MVLLFTTTPSSYLEIGMFESCVYCRTCLVVFYVYMMACCQIYMNNVWNTMLWIHTRLSHSYAHLRGWCCVWFHVVINVYTSWKRAIKIKWTRSMWAFNHMEQRALAPEAPILIYRTRALSEWDKLFHALGSSRVILNQRSKYNNYRLFSFVKLIPFTKPLNFYCGKILIARLADAITLPPSHSPPSHFPPNIPGPYFPNGNSEG